MAPEWAAWMAALQGAGSPPTAQPAAVRLSQWLDWTDSIALASLLDERVRLAAADAQWGQAGLESRVDSAAPSRMDVDRERLWASVQRSVRDALHLGDDGVEARPGSAMCRRALTSAQRQMETGVGRLRESLRQRLAVGTPVQRELAALDRVLERALIERERHLLSGAASRLCPVGDNETVADVERRLMMALEAELELRLQPLLGLMQALQPIESKT